MERYKVSGQELRDFYQQETSLKKVFQDIENDLRSTNQVVCQYIVNGLDIAESDEEKFGTVSLKDVETLEYLTENSNDLLGSVLHSWVEALPELMENTEKLAKRMRAQGFSGLLRPIHDLVQNCEYLIDSVSSLKEILGDQFLVTCPIDWVKAEQESKRTVLEALTALENKDFVLLADVLEYDLNNVLQMWRSHLQILEKVIDGEHSGVDIHSSKPGSDLVDRKRIAN